MNTSWKTYLVFFGLFAGVNAQAATWISCSCAYSMGNFKRACYSTTSCDTCCGYERANGARSTRAKVEVVSNVNEDHETKMITMMQDGPR